MIFGTSSHTVPPLSLLASFIIYFEPECSDMNKQRHDAELCFRMNTRLRSFHINVVSFIKQVKTVKRRKLSQKKEIYISSNMNIFLNDYTILKKFFM